MKFIIVERIGIATRPATTPHSIRTIRRRGRGAGGPPAWQGKPAWRAWHTFCHLPRTGPGRTAGAILRDLQDHRHAEKKAQEPAEEIRLIKAADPERPIYLVAGRYARR